MQYWQVIDCDYAIVDFYAVEQLFHLILKFIVLLCPLILYETAWIYFEQILKTQCNTN
jgi:hypothetical protein